MVKLISVGGVPNSPLNEYICDTDDDMYSLEPAPFGTIVFCAEDGKTYIAGSNGEFVEKPTGGGGSGGAGDIGGNGKVNIGEKTSVTIMGYTLDAYPIDKTFKEIAESSVALFIRVPESFLDEYGSEKIIINMTLISTSEIDESLPNYPYKIDFGNKTLNWSLDFYAESENSTPYYIIIPNQ